ncbi:PASTA domain-containing protein [Nocardia terpenica]|uniref:PASTA domain-containing protein n=1 Tax=Nocardia terpenica TaxID=455432 RepID=A0A164M0Y8_9NOCA|nr:PASTA domain-containing protein [Nocardia terpenica]KZM72924.1 hypothetical protein AWN90_29700 [Nocardia terpenica]NQE92149.1 hypothetical protein [Nocardia terpenica]
MRRFAIVVSALAVALGCAGCGGSSGGGGTAAGSSTQATKAAPTSAAQDAAAQCQAQPWPRPLPDFRGQRLGATVVGAALCFDITAITAADGSDVMHDPKSMTLPWTITAQSPAAGTPVSSTTPVTLSVAQDKRN